MKSIKVLDSLLEDYVWHTHPELVDVINQTAINTSGIIDLNNDVNYLSGQIDLNTYFINDIYSTVGANSGNWDSSADIANLSSQISVNTYDIDNISNTSGDWDSAYSTVSANSANWNTHITGGVDSSSSTTINNSVAVFDGVSGNIIKGTTVVIDNNGNLTTSGKINGRHDYGILSGNPIFPQPSMGDTYFNTTLNMNMSYDESRSSWLSVESYTLHFNRRGKIRPGIYFRTFDGIAYSSSTGFFPSYSGMITKMSYTRNNNNPIVIEATSDGTTIPFSTIASNTYKGVEENLSGVFAPYTVIGIRNQAGGSETKNVVGNATIKWLS